MFDFIRVAEDSPLLTDIYRLRYKVYCEEWGFERPEDHPGGIERDKFDARAVHFAAVRKADRKLIGTTRIIFNSELGFPIEEHCSINQDIIGLNKDHWGEISRLAVSKEFRRRAGDDSMFRNEEPVLELNSPFQDRRKNENQIVIGLYRCIYRECLEQGLTHLYAVMAKGLFLLLKRIGIGFTPAGPGVEYHGLRTPYAGCLQELMDRFEKTNKELYQCFVEGMPEPAWRDAVPVPPSGKNGGAGDTA